MSDIQQQIRGYVQDEHDRGAAAAVVGAAFEGVPRKRLGPDRFGVSRAANGSTDNPSYRLRRWIRRLRRAGLSRERAELLIADLMIVVEEEWGDRGPVTDDAVREALALEQAADAQEDEIQGAAMIDLTRLAEWVARKKRALGRDFGVVATCERYLAGQLRRAA